MGWEIHITRADFWPDSAQEPIQTEEWLALINADPELELDPRNNGPYCALWLTHEIGGDYAWFDWFRGAVSTKHPDKRTLAKALQIVAQLSANVQGDEGERYTHPDQLP